MRKWMVWFMAAVLVISAAEAQEPVQSISAIDTTKVVQITGSDDNVILDEFLIFPVESKAAIQQEIRRLYDFVNGTEGEPPILFFMPEQWQRVEQSLPEGILPEQLQVNEIQSIDEINYSSEIGDVRVEFEFATAYETGKAVSILLGLTFVDVSEEWDENTDWNTVTEWWVLEAEAMDNGNLMVMFPQVVLEKMMSSSATTMVVFNEPF